MNKKIDMRKAKINLFQDGTCLKYKKPANGLAYLKKYIGTD